MVIEENETTTLKGPNKLITYGVNCWKEKLKLWGVWSEYMKIMQVGELMIIDVTDLFCKEMIKT